MSRDDSVHWFARAQEMRGFAQTVKGGISRQLMLRMAEDYEGFARALERRPNRFRAPPAAVPAAVRLYGRRKNPAGVPLRGAPAMAIPRFLRRGPAAADEVGALP